jgi:hypothetical protein
MLDMSRQSANNTAAAKIASIGRGSERFEFEITTTPRSTAEMSAKPGRRDRQSDAEPGAHDAL